MDGWRGGRRGLGLCGCDVRLRSGDNAGELPLSDGPWRVTATAPAPSWLPSLSKSSAFGLLVAPRVGGAVAG